tara:strand:- start:180 stop:473 length:294 start_codon:yes stop_codon:yes gene_type:complete
MANRQWQKVATIKLFKNDGSTSSSHGNSAWTPWIDGSNTDIVLRGDTKYSVRKFDNDDGSMTIQISQVIADAANSGGELKKIESPLSLDDTIDDIPF